MSRFHVGGKVVERVDLLRKRHWAWRLDVWPFAILYAVWLITIVPSIDIVDAVIVLGGFVALHILVWLFTAWSVDFRCFVQYAKVYGLLSMHIDVLVTPLHLVYAFTCFCLFYTCNVRNKFAYLFTYD